MVIAEMRCNTRGSYTLDFITLPYSSLFLQFMSIDRMANAESGMKY